MTYYYRLAVLPGDAEAIHRLNYKTFVEEIPQHSPNAAGRLIDKFHTENTYMLCLKEGKLAGMIALRAARPFSLDKRSDLLNRRSRIRRKNRSKSGCSLSIRRTVRAGRSSACCRRLCTGV